jgi:hypothetical protein
MRALIAVATIAVGSRAAAAENGRPSEDFAKAIFVAELLLPDLRLEWSDFDVKHGVLSFPLVFRNIKICCDETGVAVAPFAEAQYQWANEVLRFTAGARFTRYGRDFLHVTPIVEGGAIFGEDGAGGFAGVGFGIGNAEIGILMAFVGRRIWTDEANRYDVTFDVQIPLTSKEY